MCLRSYLIEVSLFQDQRERQVSHLSIFNTNSAPKQEKKKEDCSISIFCLQEKTSRLDWDILSPRMMFTLHWQSTTATTQNFLTIFLFVTLYSSQWASPIDVYWVTLWLLIHPSSNIIGGIIPPWPWHHFVTSNANTNSHKIGFLSLMVYWSKPSTTVKLTLVTLSSNEEQLQISWSELWVVFSLPELFYSLFPARM